jgi:hypothetical protein
MDRARNPAMHLNLRCKSNNSSRYYRPARANQTAKFELGYILAQRAVAPKPLN